MKKMVIAGGSGFLGRALCKYFRNEFDEIIVLSRSKASVINRIRYVEWDAKTFGAWCEVLEGADVIINLCGKSVDCRYTPKNKEEILSSRLDSTELIGKAIMKCKTPPKLWINGASATIYRHSLDTAMTENHGETGSGFSVEVCKAWEKMFNQFNVPGMRKVNLRISMVLGNTGGVFPALLKLVKCGLGGALGKGNQQVSWIHLDDFCRMIEWLVKNESTNGIYNAVAMKPVENAVLMRLLREKSQVCFGLPATKWMLEIGAFFMRTETELILKSRYAFPERALQEGFTFNYDTIEKCLENLFSKSSN